MVTIILKKLKHLFSKSNTADSTNHDTSITKKTKDFEMSSQKPNKSHPITTQITTWLDKQAWKYEHRPLEDGEQMHHVILGFTDRENDWTCVFRINEDTQLVTIFGVLEGGVPISHYTAVLMELAKVNISIAVGGIEFDPADGEVRVKFSVDTEFSQLSDKTLSCYLHIVAGLTEVARNVVQTVLLDDEPSQFARDYVDLGDEIKTVIDDEKWVFYLPTQIAQ